MRNVLASLRYSLATCNQEYASPKASRGRVLARKLAAGRTNSP